MRTEFQFGKMKKFYSWVVVMAVQYGEYCEPHLMPLNCTHLKIVKMVNFMLYLFYHNFKKENKKGPSGCLRATRPQGGELHRDGERAQESR